jgi:CHAT domain-containing protein
LIEDLSIRFASELPSGGRPTASLRSGAILLAGDPGLAAQDADLGRLPSAAAEIASLRRIYPRAVVLEGSTLTPSRLRAALPGAALFHYAGHARSVDASPSGSHLVLAPESSTDSTARLYANDIRALNLHSLRLSVLSACETEAGDAGRAGGLDALAQAFLDAGAGGVVASQWEVDDASTAALMTTLHSSLLIGVAPQAALRAAQIAMLRDPDRRNRQPRRWGSFRYEGL